MDTSDFSHLQGLLTLLNKILVFIWNLGKGTKVLLKTINKLEGIATENFGLLLFYLTPIEGDVCVTNVCMKSRKAKLLLFVKAFLLALYFHLAIFYEEKRKFLNYFTKKNRKLL